MAISSMAKTFRSVLRAGATVALLLPVSQAAPAASAPTQVDLKLVLATDVSGSVDNDEFRIQRDGTAAAFADPEVVKAIQSGSLGRIAVAMFDFSSPQFAKIIIDWHIIKDRASAEAFADLVRESPRSPGRRTSVSSALQLGSTMLEASEKDIVATRRVIDVSGDGPNNDGDPMTDVHEKTIAQGIVVNGLPIMDESGNGFFRDLDKYYQACVAGGRGAFVVVVHNFKDFGAAMRRKLILEISQNESQIKQALNLPAGTLLRKIQADQPEPNVRTQVLRAGPNEFSQRCDIQGGFGFGGF